MTVVRTAVKDNGSGIKPSFTLGGKMEKMLGISTNAKLNPLCQKRHGCGMGCTICENCFAYGDINQYHAFDNNLAHNYEILSHEIPWGKLPEIDPAKAPLIRFESHGDLFSDIQAVNYFNIALKNRLSAFALWTKNPWHTATAVEKVGKPANLRLVFSWLYKVGCDEDLQKAYKTWDAIKEIYPWFDSIFIVLTKEYAANHSELVNCGARDCYKCSVCYTGNEEFIYEIEKQ